MFYHPRMRSGLREWGGAERLAFGAPMDGNGGAPSSHVHAPVAGAGVHRTLVPVDGSADAEHAVEYAVALAQRGLTAEIHLLNVQPIVTKGDFAFDWVVQEEHTARLAAAQQIMQSARVRLPGGVAAKVAVRFGDAASTIARYANEQGIAAIAMATRATRSLRDLFRGSVAVNVVRRVSVPVTLLKAVRDGNVRRPLQPKEAP